MSYSIDMRYTIRERAYQSSELDGCDTRPLQCSHNTHLKKIPEYNDCDFGLLVTDIQHYAYHLIFRKKEHVEEILGLTYEQNNWSLDKMWQDIIVISDSIGWNRQKVLEEVEKAKLYWYALLCIDPLEG